MGRWGIRSLETRVGQESSVSRGGARLYSGGIHVREVQRGISMCQAIQLGLKSTAPMLPL